MNLLRTIISLPNQSSPFPIPMANSRPKFVLIPGRVSSAARRLSNINPYDSTSRANREDSTASSDMAPQNFDAHQTDAGSGDDEANERRRRKIDAFMRAISRVLTPVIICMALAIWLVHSLADPKLCRPLKKGRVYEPPNSLEPVETESTSDEEPPLPEENTESSYSALAAGIFIGAFILLMVVFTFLLVWLYKAGCSKLIKGWLLVAVALILSYIGGLYIFDFCRSRCIALDWVTLSVSMWNFTITGLISVFGTAPRFINQAYLIVVSALMAYIFRTLPSWAIWVILAALVIWDLFAVLSPYGPLNMLVNLARQQNDMLPALVYDTNPESVGRGERAQPAVRQRRRQRKRRIPCINGDALNTADTGETSIRMEGSGNEVMRRVGEPSEPSESTDDSDDSDYEPLHETTLELEEDDEEIHVGTLGAHLKLGLGDFVFYSILVAQASKEGAMTALASIIAILAGLTVTLILVTAYRRALPALPISICAGLVVHFLAQFSLQPLLRELSPDMVFF